MSLIEETARLRGTFNGIWEMLWATCSKERRASFRDKVGDSLDIPGQIRA
jgi:hypothetical protein